MSEEGREGIGATGGLSLEELVERELEALRAVNGVTVATAKDRSNLRIPLNMSVPPGPLPKRYTLDPRNDSEIRALCW